MKDPRFKVEVNRDSVVDLALYSGTAERLEALYRQTARTVTRLELKVGRRVKPFGPVPRSSVPAPNTHELMRWLDDVEATDQYAEDIEFLKRLHVTLRTRVPSTLTAEVEGA
jgi:hypothetical protein